MEKIEYENKEICAECGGFCCKKCGCDYSVDDFDDLSVDAIQKLLEEGHVSIVSFQNFKEINGKMTCSPYLYLRERNINRPAVDLLSMKTRCSSLTDTGCMYSLENRPSGGVNLIPRKGEPCYPEKNPFDIVKGFERYQKSLSRVVKRMTGKSVDAQLREDVYKLFCDIRLGHFEGVMKMEIEDILGMLPMLVQAFPEEFERSRKVGNVLSMTKKSN